SSVRPELPRALDAWFARAITVKPADRFPSADEMAKGFRAALAKPATRRTRWLAASAAVLVLAVAATAGAYKANRAAVPPPSPMLAQATAAPATTDAPAAPSETVSPPVVPAAMAPVVASDAPVVAPTPDPTPAAVAALGKPGLSLAHNPSRARTAPVPSSS